MLTESCLVVVPPRLSPFSPCSQYVFVYVSGHSKEVLAVSAPVDVRGPFIVVDPEPLLWRQALRVRGHTNGVRGGSLFGGADDMLVLVQQGDAPVPPVAIPVPDDRDFEAELSGKCVALPSSPCSFRQPFTCSVIALLSSCVCVGMRPWFPGPTWWSTTTSACAWPPPL